jgi:Stage II sporulation protein E (SpoIIE)
VLLVPQAAGAEHPPAPPAPPQATSSPAAPEQGSPAVPEPAASEGAAGEPAASEGAAGEPAASEEAAGAPAPGGPPPPDALPAYRGPGGPGPRDRFHGAPNGPATHFDPRDSVLPGAASPPATPPAAATPEAPVSPGVPATPGAATGEAALPTAGTSGVEPELARGTNGLTEHGTGSVTPSGGGPSSPAPSAPSASSGNAGSSGSEASSPAAGPSSSGTPAASGTSASGPSHASGRSSGAPTVRSQTRQRGSRSSRARGAGGNGRRGGGHPTRPRGAAPVTGRVAAGPAPERTAAAGRSRGTKHTGPVHGTESRKAPSPVFRTVERIVGVVPTFVWIMMGVLALLSLTLAVSSWGATLRLRRLGRQRRRLAEDVGILQAALLPAVPERVGPLRASVAYHPAEGPAAGGDFYDVFELADERVGVIVGDVSGHGRSALPQTALIRYTLRAYLESGLAPRTALAAAGAVLEHQLGEDYYATIAPAVYDPSGHTLTYACAGHPPPFVLAGKPIEPVLASSSPPIGLGLPTGLRQTTVWLDGAAEVCLFTDGLVEARSDGELFGANRLLRALSELGPNPSAERLLSRVVAQTDRRPDDMAACLLLLDGAAGREPVRAEELELDRAEVASARPRRFLVACGLDDVETKRTIRELRGALSRGGRVLLRVLIDPEGVRGRGSPTVEIERVAPASPRVPGANGSTTESPEASPIGSSLVS